MLTEWLGQFNVIRSDMVAELNVCVYHNCLSSTQTLPTPHANNVRNQNINKISGKRKRNQDADDAENSAAYAEKNYVNAYCTSHCSVSSAGLYFRITFMKIYIVIINGIFVLSFPMFAN